MAKSVNKVTLIGRLGRDPERSFGSLVAAEIARGHRDVRDAPPVGRDHRDRYSRQLDVQQRRHAARQLVAARPGPRKAERSTTESPPAFRKNPQGILFCATGKQAIMDRV